MHKVYFVSNRDVLHETSANGNVLGKRFNSSGPQYFRVGIAEIDPDGKSPAQYDTWAVGPTRLFPEKLDSAAKKDLKFGSDQMFEALRQELKKEDRDVVVFLHGFNNDFRDSIRLTAALQAIYSTAERPLMFIAFSWPSNGNAQPAWEYFSDREDAEASGLAMGRALMKLVRFLTDLRREDQATMLEARRKGEVPRKADLRQCTRRLHLMAHSMGNWALRNALLKFLELNGGRAARVLDCAFLLAADEDNDAFELDLKLKRLDEVANRIFVYHAANDVVLTISDTTKGMPHRLGSDGPRNMSTAGDRVHAIDCRHVSTTDFLEGKHQYYRLRREVIADIRDTMKDVPQDGRPGREVIRSGRIWRLREG